MIQKILSIDENEKKKRYKSIYHVNKKMNLMKMMTGLTGLIEV